MSQKNGNYKETKEGWVRKDDHQVQHSRIDWNKIARDDAGRPLNRSGYINTEKWIEEENERSNNGD